MKLILCEKPSQAKDISLAVGSPNTYEGYIESGDYTITWGFGHLMELYDPKDYTDSWGKWNFDNLPLIPISYKMKISDGKRKQFKIIEKLIKKSTSVTIGTDADREGEAIAREILDHVAYKGHIERLWLSALDKESILKAFDNIKDQSETLPLYHAAKSRAVADWLIGMNMTRAVSIKYRNNSSEVLNIGRVQTPTFALVVKRDQDIKNFIAKDFYSLNAKIQSGSAGFTLSYKPKDKIFDRSIVERLQKEILNKKNNIKVESLKRKKSPASLFSLSLLQKDMNKKYSWGAEKTLNIAQSLYEKYKATTYPRSNSSFLPEEQKEDYLLIFKNYIDIFNPKNIKDDFKPKLRESNYDNKKITAHHAIIPTKVKIDLSVLPENEKMLYTVIYERFIVSLFPDFEYNETTISMDFVDSENKSRLFKTKGITPLNTGWKDFFKECEKEEGEDEVLPDVKDNDLGIFKDSMVVKSITTPPKYYTQGSLISDMENVGKYSDDKNLKDILKNTKGLGEEATRGSIISALIRNEFIQEKGKYLYSTEKSIRLYTVLRENFPLLLDPENTARWEEKLSLISENKYNYKDFITGIEDEIKSNISRLKSIKSIVKEKKYLQSGLYSFHPDHSTEEILHDADKWIIPGYGFVSKIIAGRVFSIEEIKDILLDNKSESMTFTGKKGPFTARLKYTGIDKKYNSCKFEFVSETKPQGENTGVRTEKYGAIIDCGKSYRCEKIKGIIFKSTFGVEISPEILKSIIDSDKEGFEMELFSKAKNKTYTAKVWFDLKNKPYPGYKLLFN